MFVQRPLDHFHNISSFSGSNKWYRGGYADYCDDDLDCLRGLNCKKDCCNHNLDCCCV